MADYFWASISIGGKIKESLVPDLTNAILEGICEAPQEDILEDLKGCKLEPKTLEYSDPQARYGHFEDVEDFCRKHGLIYVVESNGQDEYLPETRFFDGNEEVCVPCDPTNRPIMSKDDITEYIKAAKELCEDPTKVPLALNDKMFRRSHVAELIAKHGYTDPLTVIEKVIEVRYPEPVKVPALEIIS